MTFETVVSIILALEMTVLGVLVVVGFRREATLRRRSAANQVASREFPSDMALDREVREEIAALRKEFHREIDRVNSDLIKVALGRTSPRF